MHLPKEPQSVAGRNHACSCSYVDRQPHVADMSAVERSQVVVAGLTHTRNARSIRWSRNSKA